MTIHPSTMLHATSAVELRNDDGQIVATIYARSDGLEIVCQAGHTPDLGIDTASSIAHVHVAIRPEPHAHHEPHPRD